MPDDEEGEEKDEDILADQGGGRDEGEHDERRLVEEDDEERNGQQGHESERVDEEGVGFSVAQADLMAQFEAGFDDNGDAEEGTTRGESLVAALLSRQRFPTISPAAAVLSQNITAASSFCADQMATTTTGNNIR